MQTAILYEADEPGQSVNITYAELLREVSRVANVLKSWGVKKGDAVRPSPSPSDTQTPLADFS